MKHCDLEVVADLGEDFLFDVGETCLAGPHVNADRVERFVLVEDVGLEGGLEGRDLVFIGEIPHIDSIVHR